MALRLRDRFTHSIRPAYLFLKATGVELFQPEESIRSRSRSRWLMWIWSWFWLLLNTGSGIFIFLRRGVQPFFDILFASESLIGEELSWSLSAALMRGSAFIFETTTHYFLIFSIRSTLDRFINALEPIDDRLGRPYLAHLRSLSKTSVIFTVWIVIINIVCALLLEISNWMIYFYLKHPLDIIQNVIRIVNTLFTLMAIWLYVFCGQVLITHHREMASRLKAAVSPSRQETVWQVMTDFKILFEANRRLLHDFRFMLATNCCLSVVTMFSSSYYSIVSIYTQIWVIVVWNSSDTLEFCFRLWLICHVTDRVRQSISECIPVLRSFRDDESASPTERLKVTLFIIEMAQSSSRQRAFDCTNLFGMLPICKSLVLQSIETISAFLIVNFQVKNMTN